MKFEEELGKLNAGLKLAKIRVAVFVRDNHLWLRATLPPKPGAKNQLPHQQLVSTGARATIAGLRYADRKAKQMANSLDSGSFDWGDWVELKPETRKNFGELIEQYHNYRLSKSKVAPSTWKTDYLLISKKLPAEMPAGVEGILKAIALTEPDSRVRKRLVDYCGRLAKFMKLPEDDLRSITEMVGSYSAKSVNPRNLPSDEEISKFVLSIDSPGWRWVVGVIAAYGLRSHEALRLEVLDFPKLHIPENTKTGSRIVRPLYPDWANEWKLNDKILPSLDLSFDNGKLTTKVSAWFNKSAPFKALDLRHCYARRCLEFGIAPDVSAKFMGHGLKVHLETYRAWFDEKVYDDTYEKAITSIKNRIQY